jgi:hypothetical protein
MGNDLSRFHLPKPDFGAFDRDEANYKKAFPKTRLSMELGRYVIRVLPPLQPDAPFSGGFPWISVWKHSWTLAGKTNMAVCPQLHANQPCPLCDEANMGNSDMVAKMGAVCNVLVRRFTPRAAAGQPAKPEVYDPPLVLQWNIPAGILRTFKEWTSSAYAEELPFFYDPTHGYELVVVKAPKPNATDPKRDVSYTVEKLEVRQAGGGTTFAQGPITTDAAVMQHLLDKCKPLNGELKMFPALDLKSWLTTGQRPAAGLLYMPNQGATPAARAGRINSVIDAEIDDYGNGERSQLEGGDDIPF